MLIWILFCKTSDAIATQKTCENVWCPPPLICDFQEKIPICVTTIQKKTSTTVRTIQKKTSTTVPTTSLTPTSIKANKNEPQACENCPKGYLCETPNFETKTCVWAGSETHDPQKANSTEKKPTDDADESKANIFFIAGAIGASVAIVLCILTLLSRFVLCGKVRRNERDRRDSLEAWDSKQKVGKSVSIRMERIPTEICQSDWEVDEIHELPCGNPLHRRISEHHEKHNEGEHSQKRVHHHKLARRASGVVEQSPRTTREKSRDCASKKSPKTSPKTSPRHASPRHASPKRSDAEALKV